MTISAYIPERIKPVLDCSDDPGETQQHHKDSCDINYIVDRFTRTGVIDHLAAYGPRYGDFNGPDYLGAQLIVKQAEEAFQALPARVRARFDQDPVKFMDYVHTIDPENPPAEFYELGITTPKKPAAKAAKNGSEDTPDEPKPIDPT